MRDFKSLTLSVTCIGTVAAALLNCTTQTNEDTSSSESNLDGVEYVDCEQIAGVPGKLPKDDTLSPMQQIGRCTWVLSTGRTTKNPNYAVDSYGNPSPMSEGVGGTENLLHDIAKKNGTIMPVLETLGAKSEADRETRWKKYGVMNDPGCKASGQEDEYGLQLDTCVDPYSAGAVGIRKFPNPAFKGAAKARWMELKAQGREALMQAYRTDPNLEAPYLVGQTCGSCHTSFDPARPPADPAHPKWENLKFTLGNQYFKEGEFFKAGTNGKDDFRWHALDTQQAGTSDTSRIPNDHINNPNSINPIFSLLFRPWHTEKLKKSQITFDLTADVCPDLGNSCDPSEKVPVTTALALLRPDEAARAIAGIRRQAKSDGEPHAAQSILKGGEDSVGPVGALLRVYVNIGMCSSMWLRHFDPIVGNGEQTPVETAELYRDCPSYQQMLNRVPATVLFLASQGPIYLKDAPNGAAHINDELAEKGKLVFAENCATCHSSKQPPADVADKKSWFRDAVQQDDWLLGNFLSDDVSHPVTEIGTNIARASHTNHMAGHVWGSVYASQSYNDRKWPGEVELFNPYGRPIKYKGPDGGPGYYRTPTLISIWSRAPFFHNKALGAVDPATNQVVVPGPSVEDRVAAFETAAKMLLSPELRPKTTANGIEYPGYVKTTSSDSVLAFSQLGLTFKVRVPAGTPVNLFASLDQNDNKVKAEFAALAVTNNVAEFNPKRWLPTDLGYANSGSHLLNMAGAPDLVENKGHTFGAELSQADKDAVIEYLKTL